MFSSWGVETVNAYSLDEISAVLAAFDDENRCGSILRAKGIVPGLDGRWIHFDYVPGEPDVREGKAGVIGRLCVIGCNLNETALKTLCGV